MVRCESKYGHKENTCLKNIELHAPNVKTILALLINIIGVWLFKKHDNLHFNNEQDIHYKLQNYKKIATVSIGFAKHFVFSIPYEMWASRKEVTMKL